MNRGPLLFVGILVVMATSFWGLVLVPDMKVGHQQQITNALTGALYPAPRAGLAQAGAGVYRSLGCVECHSQQVRGVGSDLARGWGPRMTVAQDYLGDYPVFLGHQRIGPDLANIGLRETSANNLLTHLYNPQAVRPGSMMPRYPFLFDKRKLRPGQAPAPNAVMVKDGYQVVPRPEAEALAAYLLSLRTDSPLFEAPTPRGAGAPTTASTNSVATNSTGSKPAGPVVPVTNPPAAGAPQNRSTP